MQKCKICGSRIEDGIAVCPSCGAKVVSSSTMPDAGTNANVAAGTVRPRVSSTTQVIKTTCAHCGAEVIGEHRFCPQCGVNLKEAAAEKKAAAPQERRCPQCGSVVQENSRFSPDCGQELGASISAKAASAPAQQTAPAAKASSPAPATNSTGNTRKIRISLIPESLTEMTAYFDSVQDFCSSPEVQNMSGMPTLAVDGELTEDELDSIVDFVAQGRKVKAFNLSSCKNVRQLKDEQFFAEELFRRCTGLETVQLPYGRTFTQVSTKKATPRKNTTPKKKGKGLLIAAIIIGAIACVSVISLQFNTTFYNGPLNINNGIVTGVKDKNIVSVEIPNKVTSIGSKAFADCTSLTSVTIPNSVKSIGASAFDGCTSLSSIYIPSPVASIGVRAFAGCTSLRKLENLGSITSIANSTFYGCDSLTHIYIPSSVTSIGSRAFVDCSSLVDISIPNSVISIGDSAFSGCPLKSINLPNSVSYIGDSAFGSCTSLSSITIPSSVAFIGSYAFQDCTSLKSITIPSNVTSIGYRAFDGCKGLTVTCPKGSYAEQYCKKNNIRYTTQ